VTDGREAGEGGEGRADRNELTSLRACPMIRSASPASVQASVPSGSHRRSLGGEGLRSEWPRDSRGRFEGLRRKSESV
jgi:hypothetical protein